jgi:MFS family permease
VFTVFLSLVSLVVPFGMIFGGLFADRFGAPLLFVVGGLVCIAAAGISFATPAILTLEENTPQSRQSKPELATAESA